MKIISKLIFIINLNICTFKYNKSKTETTLKEKEEANYC